jgi:AcrR family transcriptional regulator
MDKVFQNIIKTAAELYKKFGLKSVTMDDVARECMISKKTLYKYVNDKIDLLKQAFKFEFSIQSNLFESITEKGLNAVEEVFEIHKHLIKMLKTHNPVIEHDMMKYYPVIHREMKEKSAKQVYKMMLQNLKKGIEEGLYYNDIDIELVAKQRVIFQVQKIENSIVSFKEFTTPHALRQMFIYHLRAICSPEGLKILNEKINEFDN